MPYEIFTRKVARTGTPMMSFSKLGQIVFNQSAAAILQKDSTDYILLMWDATENKMAVKHTSNKKDPRAYHIRYAEKGNGAGFSAKTFLDYIGIDCSDRRALPIDIDTNRELIIEAKLPDTFFKKKPEQPRPIQRGKSG